MHFNQRGPLLLLAALLRRTLSRTGHRNAGLCRDSSYRLRKIALFHLHDELKDIAANTAAKTVVNLLYGVDGKRRRFFRVEWTEAGKVLAALLQPHIFADYANNVCLLLNAIGE